jgi:hypothetical protein
MNVMAGEGRGRPSLRAFERAPRVRAGDNPVWVDLPISTAEGRAWRARASAHGIGIDAWLAVLVEFHLATRRSGVVLSHVKVAETSESATARLAPTDGLRRWSRLLAGQWHDHLPQDELPTVVLPERLVAQTPRAELWPTVRSAVSDVDEQLALRCERVAASQGVTLEVWVLRAALETA